VNIKVEDPGRRSAEGELKKRDDCTKRRSTWSSAKAAAASRCCSGPGHRLRPRRPADRLHGRRRHRRADRLVVMDPLDGFGQQRRDGQHLDLGGRCSGGSGMLSVITRLVIGAPAIFSIALPHSTPCVAATWISRAPRLVDQPGRAADRPGRADHVVEHQGDAPFDRPADDVLLPVSRRSRGACRRWPTGRPEPFGVPWPA
jgi:hypothetical protein